MEKRVFLIVLDSFGIGELPDAARFSDEGSNTLRSICKSAECDIPNLTRLGLFAIDGTPDLSHDSPLARVARMTEKSAGKDTTIGHWEIAGCPTGTPLPTYPNGFPKRVLEAFSLQTGRGVLCNRPYSGTEVIRDYGLEHEKTGDWIVYTSADSVFQIAAHESIVPLPELYAACQKAREILTGDDAVGRVIARPFTGAFPHYTRTKNRHDFSLSPPENTMLDRLKDAGKEVISIGKIFDIFAGRGITRSIPTGSNNEGMKALKKVQSEPFCGLCFANLVDFDMLYGHRNDVDGYARALSEFDRFLGDFLKDLLPDDLLILCADHGCDPATPSTDHSREYTPCLVYGKAAAPTSIGTRPSFSDIAATVLSYFSLPVPDSTRSLLE